jgi:hypothetical protein
MTASILCRLTPQFGKVEYYWRQPSVDIPGAKPWSKLSADLFGIGAFRIP